MRMQLVRNAKENRPEAKASEQLSVIHHAIRGCSLIGKHEISDI